MMPPRRRRRSRARLGSIPRTRPSPRRPRPCRPARRGCRSLPRGGCRSRRTGPLPTCRRRPARSRRSANSPRQ
ncbi:hypothetical protein DT073_13630 [Microbacterium sp. ABRD28]|nr:hypothetical protein DT073_13630 [Microbacterium sp. ABRD28]